MTGHPRYVISAEDWFLEGALAEALDTEEAPFIAVQSERATP